MENLLCIRQGTVSLKQIFVNSEERSARSLRGVSRCDPSGLKKAREEGQWGSAQRGGEGLAVPAGSGEEAGGGGQLPAQPGAEAALWLLGLPRPRRRRIRQIRRVATLQSSVQGRGRDGTGRPASTPVAAEGLCSPRSAAGAFRASRTGLTARAGATRLLPTPL